MTNLIATELVNNPDFWEKVYREDIGVHREDFQIVTRRFVSAFTDQINALPSLDVFRTLKLTAEQVLIHFVINPWEFAGHYKQTTPSNLWVAQVTARVLEEIDDFVGEYLAKRLPESTNFRVLPGHFYPLPIESAI